MSTGACFFFVVAYNYGHGLLYIIIQGTHSAFLGREGEGRGGEGRVKEFMRITLLLSFFLSFWPADDSTTVFFFIFIY